MTKINSSNGSSSSSSCCSSSCSSSRSSGRSSWNIGIALIWCYCCEFIVAIKLYVTPAGGQCGVSQYSDAGDMELPPGKIVGGIEARPYEFPWQVRSEHSFKRDLYQRITYKAYFIKLLLRNRQAASKCRILKDRQSIDSRTTGVSQITTAIRSCNLFNLQATKGGGTHPLRFFRCHTFCIWNRILTF